MQKQTIVSAARAALDSRIGGAQANQSQNTQRTSAPQNPTDEYDPVADALNDDDAPTAAAVRNGDQDGVAGHRHRDRDAQGNERETKRHKSDSSRAVASGAANSNPPASASGGASKLSLHTAGQKRKLEQPAGGSTEPHTQTGNGGSAGGRTGSRLAGRLGVREEVSVSQDEQSGRVDQTRRLCGVGMVLAPKDPGRDGYCFVKKVKEGGPLAGTKKVVDGHVLVKVGGRDCRGMLREQVRELVVGAAGSEIALVFMAASDRLQFEVVCRRAADLPDAAQKKAGPGGEAGQLGDGGGRERGPVALEQGRGREDGRPVCGKEASRGGEREEIPATVLARQTGERVKEKQDGKGVGGRREEDGRTGCVRGRSVDGQRGRSVDGQRDDGRGAVGGREKGGDEARRGREDSGDGEKSRVAEKPRGAERVREASTGDRHREHDVVRRESDRGRDGERGSHHGHDSDRRLSPERGHGQRSGDGRQVREDNVGKVFQPGRREDIRGQRPRDERREGPRERPSSAQRENHVRHHSPGGHGSRDRGHDAVRSSHTPRPHDGQGSRPAASPRSREREADSWPLGKEAERPKGGGQRGDRESTADARHGGRSSTVGRDQDGSGRQSWGGAAQKTPNSHGRSGRAAGGGTSTGSDAGRGQSQGWGQGAGYAPGWAGETARGSTGWGGWGECSTEGGVGGWASGQESWPGWGDGSSEGWGNAGGHSMEQVAAALSSIAQSLYQAQAQGTAPEGDQPTDASAAGAAEPGAVAAEADVPQHHPEPEESAAVQSEEAEAVPEPAPVEVEKAATEEQVKVAGAESMSALGEMLTASDDAVALAWHAFRRYKELCGDVAGDPEWRSKLGDGADEVFQAVKGKLAEYGYFHKFGKLQDITDTLADLSNLGWDEEKDVRLVEGLARNAGYVTDSSTFTDKLNFFSALKPFKACAKAMESSRWHSHLHHLSKQLNAADVSIAAVSSLLSVFSTLSIDLTHELASKLAAYTASELRKRAEPTIVSEFFAHSRTHAQLGKESPIWVALLHGLRAVYSNMSDEHLVTVFVHLGGLLDDNKSNVALLAPVWELLDRDQLVGHLAAEAVERAPQMSSERLTDMLWCLAVTGRWRPTDGEDSALVTGASRDVENLDATRSVRLVWSLATLNLVDETRAALLKVQPTLQAACSALSVWQLVDAVVAFDMSGLPVASSLETAMFETMQSRLATFSVDHINRLLVRMETLKPGVDSLMSKAARQLRARICEIKSALSLSQLEAIAQTLAARCSETTAVEPDASAEETSALSNWWGWWDKRAKGRVQPDGQRGSGDGRKEDERESDNELGQLLRLVLDELPRLHDKVDGQCLAKLMGSISATRALPESTTVEALRHSTMDLKQLLRGNELVDVLKGWKSIMDTSSSGTEEVALSRDQSGATALSRDVSRSDHDESRSLVSALVSGISQEQKLASSSPAGTATARGKADDRTKSPSQLGTPLSSAAPLADSKTPPRPSENADDTTVSANSPADAGGSQTRDLCIASELVAILCEQLAAKAEAVEPRALAQAYLALAGPDCRRGPRALIAKTAERLLEVLTKRVAKLRPKPVVAVLSASVSAAGCVEEEAHTTRLKLLAYVYNRLDQVDGPSCCRLLAAQAENRVLLDHGAVRDMVRLVLTKAGELSAKDVCVVAKSVATLSFRMSDLDLLSLLQTSVGKVFQEGFGVQFDVEKVPVLRQKEETMPETSSGQTNIEQTNPNADKMDVEASKDEKGHGEEQSEGDKDGKDSNGAANPKKDTGEGEKDDSGAVDGSVMETHSAGKDDKRHVAFDAATVLADEEAAAVSALSETMSELVAKYQAVAEANVSAGATTRLDACERRPTVEQLGDMLWSVVVLTALSRPESKALLQPPAKALILLLARWLCREWAAQRTSNQRDLGTSNEADLAIEESEVPWSDDQADSPAAEEDDKDLELDGTMEMEEVRAAPPQIDSTEQSQEPDAPSTAEFEFANHGVTEEWVTRVHHCFAHLKATSSKLWADLVVVSDDTQEHVLQAVQQWRSWVGARSNGTAWAAGSAAADDVRRVAYDLKMEPVRKAYHPKLDQLRGLSVSEAVTVKSKGLALLVVGSDALIHPVKHDSLRYCGSLALRLESVACTGWQTVCIAKTWWEAITGEMERKQALSKMPSLGKLVGGGDARKLDAEVLIQEADSAVNIVNVLELLVCMPGGFGVLSPKPSAVASVFRKLGARYRSGEVDPIVAGRIGSVVLSSEMQDVCVEQCAKYSPDDMTSIVTAMPLIWEASGRQKGQVSRQLFETMSWQMLRGHTLQQCAADTIGEVASAYVALSEVVGEEAMKRAANAMLSTMHDTQHAANLPPKSAVALAVAAGLGSRAGVVRFEKQPGLESRLIAVAMQGRVEGSDLSKLLALYPFGMPPSQPLLRVLSNAAGQKASEMTGEEVTAVVHAHLLHGKCISEVADAVSTRLLEPAVTPSMSIEDGITVLYSMAALGDSNDKLSASLTRHVVVGMHKRLSGGSGGRGDGGVGVGVRSAVRLLWSVASGGGADEVWREFESVEAVLLRRLNKVGVEGVGREHEESDGGKKEDAEKEASILLQQYFNWVKQKGRKDVLSQTDVWKLEREVGKAAQRRELQATEETAGIRKDVVGLLGEMNVPVDELVPLHHLGYTLTIKLRAVNTSIEIYGRSDCLEAAGTRAPNVKPNGIWHLREQQLRREGFQVLVVGFEQWQGLRRDDKPPQAPQEFLVKLLNTYSWLLAPQNREPAAQGAPAEEEKAEEAEEDDPPVPSGDHDDIGEEPGQADDDAGDGDLLEGSSKSKSKDKDKAKRKRKKEGGSQRKKDKKGAKDEGLLWTLHYSSKKEMWFYFNVETQEKVWKPPKVDGWVIKSCSGKHRPYIGLRQYYYNPATAEVKYEPPLLRRSAAHTEPTSDPEPAP